MHTVLALRKPARPRRAQVGFTAIETLIVMAIAAILLTVATPSLTDLMQRNRVAGRVNAFVGDLQFARSEAVRQGGSVVACASANGVACLAGGNWETGWMVFVDTDKDGDRQASETVLRTQERWTGGDTFVAGSSVSAFRYDRYGFAEGLPGTVVMTLHTDPQNPGATRCVAVTPAGRQEVQKVNGGSCS